MWFNAGRADVVRWLALKLEEQNNVELEGLDVFRRWRRQ